VIGHVRGTKITMLVRSFGCHRIRLSAELSPISRFALDRMFFSANELLQTCDPCGIFRVSTSVGNE
jgi:hypothetical protein